MYNKIGNSKKSIGVFIASLLIYYRPDWKIADPLCTFVFRSESSHLLIRPSRPGFRPVKSGDTRQKEFFFSFLVTYTTIPIMQDVTSVLMHKVPTTIDIDHVKNFLLDNQVTEDLECRSLIGCCTNFRFLAREANT